MEYAPRTSTVLGVTIGSAILGLTAYAVYFDHRRRTDPEFRKALKRESKRHAKVEKAEAQARKASHELAIHSAVDKLNAEGYPKQDDAREAFVMEQLSNAETLARDNKVLDSASCLFRALKAYPRRQELLNILDHAITNKDVLDTLAKMIAIDDSMNDGGVS